MDISSVYKFFDEKGLPKFRGSQVFDMYFSKYGDSWDDVTTLSKELREELKEKFPWSTIDAIKTEETEDAVKTLFKTEDGAIESVLIKHDDGRRTVCVSSQIGCPMKCSFCATGKMGFTRNLESYEIYEQVMYMARFLKKTNEKITNIVFMGMGEPMLNFDAVKKAITVLHDSEGFNLGWRHFSISTCGIIDGIKRHAKELPQVNLAISLHAPDDVLRSKLMPVNDRFPIKEIMRACDDFVHLTNKKIFFEYVLLKGVNDTPSIARALATLMKTNPLYHVNLIRYHAHTREEKSVFAPSDQRAVELFVKTLEHENVPVTVRRSFGEQIHAACGQLAAKK